MIFPMELTGGKVVPVSGLPLVRASIKNILMYPFGLRPWLHQFGSKLHLMLEQPNDIVLQAIAQEYIVDAITRWEKRVELLNTTTIRQGFSNMEINLSYRVVGTKEIDSVSILIDNQDIV